MARDVRSSLKRQVTYEKQFLHHPLLIMNGFSGDAREIQLTSSMFQNMFPSINVAQVRHNFFVKFFHVKFTLVTKLSITKSEIFMEH